MSPCCLSGSSAIVRHSGFRMVFKSISFLKCSLFLIMHLKKWIIRNNPFAFFYARHTDMKKFLNSLLVKIDGLYSVVVTDRDGVPILKASCDKAPESALRPSFLSTFGMAADQGSKLGLGKNNAVICLYSNYQVVQMNDLPLIVSFIASHDCNTGHILSQKQTLHQMLQSLKGSVVEP